MIRAARRLRRWAALGAGAAIALSVAGSAAVAQSAPRSAREARWGAARISKWALFGTSVALGAYALAHSGRASRAYGELHRRCERDAATCRLADGRYADASAEALYRETVRHDRRARIGILGGHAALLGSAALFVADLRQPRAPGDIPFPVPGGGAPLLAIGARLAF